MGAAERAEYEVREAGRILGGMLKRMGERGVLREEDVRDGRETMAKLKAAYDELRSV